jgi:hypothetical protein
MEDTSTTLRRPTSNSAWGQSIRLLRSVNDLEAKGTFLVGNSLDCMYEYTKVLSLQCAS